MKNIFLLSIFLGLFSFCVVATSPLEEPGSKEPKKAKKAHSWGTAGDICESMINGQRKAASILSYKSSEGGKKEESDSEKLLQGKA